MAFFFAERESAFGRHKPDSCVEAHDLHHRGPRGEAQKTIPSPDKTIEWGHINRVEVRIRLLELTRTVQPIFAWANVTFKQATVLKAFVASGTFLPSLFRERARVPSKANASKPRDPRRIRSETVRGMIQVTRSVADRSREILVSAGSQGDLARDSAFASPAGWTLTKSPSEEPA